MKKGTVIIFENETEIRNVLIEKDEKILTQMDRASVILVKENCPVHGKCYTVEKDVSSTFRYAKLKVDTVTETMIL